jgi:RNA polymerase sigma-70 factor (ECF subfamily)
MSDSEPNISSSPPEFSELVKRHAEKAYNFAYRLVGNEQDARDLVQEAFLHALKHFQRYDSTRPFGPWFNRILKNIFLDAVRKYERKHTISLDDQSPLEDVSWLQLIAGKDPSPSEEMDQQETHVYVQKALNSLPMLYKTAIVLCDVEQRSYDEIAEILECPVGTVRSRIHQGRVLLRKAFEKLQYGTRDLEVVTFKERKKIHGH